MLNSKLNKSGLINFLSKKGEVFLLESQMKNHPSSNRSYLAGSPKAVIKAWGNQVEITENGQKHELSGDPLKEFAAFKEKYPGWLFGYFGYDLKNFTENLSSENKAYITTPDLYFIAPELVVEFKGDEFSVIEGSLPNDLRRTEIKKPISLTEMSHIAKEEYLSKIEEAKLRIKEGDFYEINLSHALEFNFEGDSWDLFNQMKEIGPVPFASYIKADSFDVCCASPERFLKKSGNMLISQPIKGTISRNGKSDTVNIQALQSSEKDRAENLMIVDLVRNDLGRVAKKGSVNVSDLFEIQSFETVHQMVSTVKAELKEGTQITDIIRSTFPMGSMTGAPKISAMKAIEELENYKRGIYSGSIGYITPENDFDFNVVIRSAIIQNEKLIYPVGGAITADSIPEDEWEETFVKAQAITRLLN